MKGLSKRYGIITRIPFDYISRGEWGADPSESTEWLKTYLLNGDYDLVFIGGIGLHYLLRKGPMEIGARDDPIQLHRSLVRAFLNQLYSVATFVRIPIVFLGTIPIDAEVIHLQPAKRDWGNFFDFSLASIWDSIEATEFRKNIVKSPWLFHLRLSSLTRVCPGIRCDGMHFGSDYQDFGCRTSEALLDGALARFLVDSIGLGLYDEGTT
jgi:hypothetical protein